MKNKSQTSLLEEIIVDNFAGGGGASTGIELATGRPVTIAVNHDPEAIRMHLTNHPYTEHYQASVWDIDPAEVCRGRPVGLAWFSPDCKHFSRAKGGKPVSKNIRGLALIVLRWAAKVSPRVIILENVPEFVTWGPVRKGKLVKSKSGQTFNKWLTQLRELGYEIKYQKLKACDYGAPTIRERFFLVARRDGQPIVFPKPTHGEGDNLKPYRTAAECIDWSIPCKSIFGRKKPLAENTMRRIARGLDKFTLKSDNPFIVNYKFNNPPESINEPLCTITVKGKDALTAAHLVKYYSGDDHYSGTNKPLHTVTTKDRNALVESHLCILRNNEDCRSIKQPLPTITTSGAHFAVIRTKVEKYDKNGNFGNWNEVRKLLNKHCGYSLAEDEILLLEIDGDWYFISDIGMRMLEPRELYRAQGFPDDYIIDRDFTGREYSRKEQVARCGNAVPPPFAEALVRANLPEWCGEKIVTMAQFADMAAV